MRRALGLHNDTRPRSTSDHQTTSTSGSHPQRRRFIRDGEVPVTVVNRDHRLDDNSGANQLDAARQAIRSQATAREHAERLLAEAQTTVRTLQTTLAHERLAKDEVIQRAEADRQALQGVRGELLAERAARDRLAQSVNDFETTIQGLQGKLSDLRAELAAERQARQKAEAIDRPAVTMPTNGEEAAVPVLRRPVGRPRKIVAVQPVEKPDEPSVKNMVPGDTVKPKSSGKPGRPAQPRPAQQRTATPIKWWL